MSSRLAELVREAKTHTRTSAGNATGAIADAFRGNSRLSAPIIYALSVLAERAASLISLPLVTIYVSPAEYGNYDVAISIVELVFTVMALAIAPTVVRFASTAPTDAEASRWARELMGTALVFVAVFGTLIVAAAPSVAGRLGVDVDAVAFRILIASAVMASCVDLPLMWLRLKNWAWTYFWLIFARTATQLVMMFLALHLGYGIPGLMVANGATVLAFACVLLGIQWHQTGLGVSRQALASIIRYGLPIVTSGVLLFGLGSANRWFLPGSVSTEAIAHFGLASRLALIVPLLFYPFLLWWGPRQISSLREPNGYALGARMWGIGISLLIVCGLGLALVGPVAVLAVLPSGYAPSIGYLNALIVAQALHQLVHLTSAGNYARENGLTVLGIDAAGAATAIMGYVVLLPLLSINGVVLAMVLGSLLRLGLNVWFGAKHAPLPYPWTKAIAAGFIACAMVVWAPGSDHYLLRVIYTAMSVPLMTLALVWIGLLRFTDGERHVRA